MENILFKVIEKKSMIKKKISQKGVTKKREERTQGIKNLE